MQKYLLLNVKHFSVSNASPFLKKPPLNGPQINGPLINRKDIYEKRVSLTIHRHVFHVVNVSQKKCVNKSCDTDPLSTNISLLQIFQDKFLLGLLSIGPTDFTNSLNVSYLNAPLFFTTLIPKEVLLSRFFKIKLRGLT